MDIFTTQLTRVVPVPIKPANLKVKALLKEAGTGKLKEDPDHLENHDYYFARPQLDEEQDSELENKEHAKQDNNENVVQPSESANLSENKRSENKHVNQKGDGVTVSEDGVKHLDLYV